MLEHEEPQGKRRRAQGWPPTQAEAEQLGRVLEALRLARVAAGMPVPAKGYAVTRTNSGAAGGSPGFLGRLRELAEEEDDPVALLCALVRVRVAEQAARVDSPRHREGRYASGTTLCRDQHWVANLNAARAALAKAEGKAPTGAPREVDGVPLTEDERAWWAREAKQVDPGTVRRHLRDRRMEAAQ